MLAARIGLMPSISRSRSGVDSMTSKTFSPKERTKNDDFLGTSYQRESAQRQCDIGADAAFPPNPKAAVR
jgi:hypothetical protein